MMCNSLERVQVLADGQWTYAWLVNTISDIDGLWRGEVAYVGYDGRPRREWRAVQDLRPLDDNRDNSSTSVDVAVSQLLA
jgi:hypothetical protein